MDPIKSNSTDRFVLIFDTDNSMIREDLAPSLLQADGFPTKHYFPRLGIAVVGGDNLDFEALEAHCGERQIPLTVRPETKYYALSEPPYDDTAELTWGLQAIRAEQSSATGAGIRVAVLDTGFHTGHPDFAGRTVVAESFIEGEGPEDLHGHGTHCIGTACGPRSRAGGPGYGVAPAAEIYSGKVLDVNGEGTDTTILTGIDWALQHGCQVISMSLGADVREVHPPYVAAGRRALEQGSLIVAAAGNNASRSQGNPGFVGAPANSPYIMAVGAVDQSLQVADFSARAIPEDGGEVDIVAPGVDVYSSWIAPEVYNTISGTSMATPHVSGVAALIAESTGATGQDLWDQIIANVQPLNQDVADVGAGLSVAPSSTSTGTQPQDREWVITVDDAHTQDLGLVADTLRSRGVQVTRTLPALGIIHAHGSNITKEELTGIVGVASADTNHRHQLRETN